MKDAVMPYIKISAWFSHNEAVLQTSLCINRDDGLKLAVRKVLELRGERDLRDMSVRTMGKLRLNTDATTRQELID